MSAPDQLKEDPVTVPAPAPQGEPVSDTTARKPCRASVRIGCPDSPTVLVCHQPTPHPGLNHYDAAERIYWQRTNAEPWLLRSPDAPVAEPACICVRFRDTGGFRVGDLTCPVHGVEGTEPLDGPWDDAPVSPAARTYTSAEVAEMLAKTADRLYAAGRAAQREDDARLAEQLPFLVIRWRRRQP